jgi:hypothetical protein
LTRLCASIRCNAGLAKKGLADNGTKDWHGKHGRKEKLLHE